MTNESQPSSPLAKAAQAMIDAKLALLDEWLKKGIPWLRSQDGRCICGPNDERVLDYYPDDIRAFAMWTSKQHCQTTLTRYPQLLQFKSFSRSTLNQNHNITRKDLTITKLAAVKDASKQQLEKANANNILAEFTAEIHQLRRLVKIQEHEIYRYREDARIAREEAEATNRLYERQQKYAEEHIKKLEKQLQGRPTNVFRETVVPLRRSKKTPSSTKPDGVK
ncbi:hypothetical protein [Cupriavidus basilensis]|uniref:hypothetical protein n=1 Tax=Cupriavidus basilensis TaxID=68895 RepID=UPI0020A64460|nr:hypothetical protein [Cupriavidus basilensis]MCP3022774.1 hypothetical protein [Cupriavidus basilensis]